MCGRQEWSQREELGSRRRKVHTSALLLARYVIISFISTFSFNIARLKLMVDMEVIFNCVYMCVGAEEGVHQSQGACGDQKRMP